MGDLVCVTIFSQTSGERIFSSIMHQERIFFSVKEFFSAVLIFFQDFFPRNQFVGYIFLKSPLPPPPPSLKRQMVGPLLISFICFSSGV